MTIFYLISKPRSDVGLAELNAGYYALKNLEIAPARVIKAERIPDLKIARNDIMWCHLPCEDFQDEYYQPEFQKKLLSLVENGNSLLLTLTAATLPFITGIESVKPTISKAGRWRGESGHYAFRGMAAFDEHPLFNSKHRMRTRFYSWTPQAGEPYWLTAYRKNRPESVIARGIRYLSEFDDDACCWEYRIGKGIILCVGGYLYYNARRNYQRYHSEAFLENCLNYIKEKPKQDSKRYWPVLSAGTIKAKPTEDLFDHEIEIKLEPEKYFDRPGLPSQKTSENNNFFSCAGRRMLVMGLEGKSIGEIWSYPVRLMKDFKWSILPDGRGNIPQEGMPYESVVFPDIIHQKYEYSSYGVREQIGCDIFKPAAYLHHEIVAERNFKFQLNFNSDMAMMWPMPAIASGKISYRHDPDQNRIICRSENKGLWWAFYYDVEPESVKFRDASEEDSSNLEVTITFPLKEPGIHYYCFAILGGDARLDIPNYDSRLILNSKMDIDRSGDHYRKLIQNSFKVTSEDPAFDEAILWAQMKMEAFRAITPGIGRGITAGLAISGEDWLASRPGYGWYFGRDSIWCAFGLLSCGQWNVAADALRLLADYQDIDGKIFHELSPSNFPHYDSADANPLFVVLAERYLAWTGDDQTIESIRPEIKKALEFSFHNDRDGDCLTENTGVGHGWIEGGKLFGAHVTFYLAGLWMEALLAGIKLFEKDKDRTFLTRLTYTAAKVAELLRSLYWDEERNTYYYGKLQDGSMQQADTIMPAAVILFGQTDKEMDINFLKRASGPDIVTDWGARMISELDERYNPTGYHIGSVWPLYTGWLGLAQYQRGRDLQGFELLTGGLSSYKDFSVGCFSEVLRGDYYEEIGVCPQQAWSATMLLWLTVRGILGLEPETGGMITLAPVLPPHWRKAQFENLRWSDGLVDLDYKREGETVIFTIKGLDENDRMTFSPRFPAGTGVDAVIINGEEIEPNIKRIDRKPQVTIPLHGSGSDLVIEFQLLNYFSPIPCFQAPEIGKPSRGYRIIDSGLGTDSVWVDLVGLAGTKDELHFVDPGCRINPGSAKHNRDGEHLSISIRFPDASRKYSRVSLSFLLEGL